MKKEIVTYKEEGVSEPYEMASLWVQARDLTPQDHNIVLADIQDFCISVRTRVEIKAHITRKKTKFGV